MYHASRHGSQGGCSLYFNNRLFAIRTAENKTAIFDHAVYYQALEAYSVDNMIDLFAAIQHGQPLETTV